MSTPNQSTVNQWCNSEAVHAMAEGLDKWADKLSPMFSGPHTTDFCNPLCHHEADRNDAIGLRHAANLLRQSADDAASAIRQAQNHAYDRLYNEPYGWAGGIK